MQMDRTRCLMLLKSAGRACSRIDKSRTMMTASIQNIINNHFVFTSSSNITPDNVVAHDQVLERKQNSRTLDDRISMLRMRNNFSGPGPGLQSGKNRQDLVAEFFDLTKTVFIDKISVEEFENSQTMRNLHEQINLHIDIMSNAQIVNILASMIKMRVNPSLKLVKLLEHEVKFRVNTLTLSQVMKLVRFYNNSEMSYEQRQITDILNNRIRGCLNSNKSSLRDLVDVYGLLASQQAKSTMLSLTEERLLNLFTSEDDDIVSQYLPKDDRHDYATLCDLFIALANARRRPTPLLKAATKTLTNTPLPNDEENKITVSQLLSTLNSLVSLNYINRVLTSKLIDDFTSIVKLDDLDLDTQCNLLRTLNSLKWRSTKLFELFYEYVERNQDHSKRLDHNLFLTIIYTTAQLNYKPKIDLKQLYTRVMNNERSSLIDRNSRKWLNHVWSLALLGIEEKIHLESVLNDKFIEYIETASGTNQVSHADMMKLLNLRGIATLDYKCDEIASKYLEVFADQKIQRSADMQKFANKIKESLVGIVSSDGEFRHEIQTPFGFLIDCELLLATDTNQLLSINSNMTLEESIRLAAGKPEHELQTTNCQEGQKCALVYVPFDETISNYPEEALGHKQIISRIMKSLGYKTVYLTENVLSRERTSADLTNRIKEMILSVVKQ